MNDMTLKAQEESPGWTRPSDIAWMAGYLIATILTRASVGKRSGVSPSSPQCKEHEQLGTELMRAAPH